MNMANDIILDGRIENVKGRLDEIIYEVDKCIKNGDLIDLGNKELDFFNDEIKKIVNLINKLILKYKKNEDIVNSLEEEVMKRKLAEALLKNERDYVATVLNKTALLVVLIDSNGNIISLNKACEELTGYLSDKVKGLNIWNILIKEFKEKDIEVFLKEIESFESKNNIVNYWTMRNGEEKVVSWSITAILNEKSEMKAYAITGLDITKIEENKIQLENQAKTLEENNLELLENQKIIKEEKDKAQKYLNIAGVIILALDKDRKVTLINDSGCEVLGLKREYILGKDWFEIAVPFRKRENSKRIFNKIINDNIQKSEYIEEEIVDKNGKEKLIAWRNLLLYDNLGNVIGILSSGNDITKQKEIEIMKSEIINTVSHEIRTPLGSILGFSELMLKRELPSEKMRSYLNTIYKEAVRLMDLINDFLDIQRIENGKLVFNMVEFYIEEIIENLKQIFENNSKHKLCVYMKKNVKVFADYNKILQVLTNFMSNAVKYSPEASIINLKIETIGDGINFCVEDFGFGIKKEYLDKIFNKFYRVEQEKNVKIQGTGLGLTICKEIISAHGGIIWVESKVGVGSKFYFSIPLART